MSFILDALKKSETDRQQQGGAEFSAVPTATPGPRAPRWIYALVTLLVINVVAVAWLLLRPQPAAPAGSASAAPIVVAKHDSTPAIETDSFERRVAQARAKQPAEPPAAATMTTAPDPAPEPSPAPSQSRPGAVADDVPTLLDLRAQGLLSLPDLHLDIHVYSDTPSERFVFVNMNKHREGSVLDAGPRVAEITVDGVVLDYEGRRFKLPRE